MILFLQQKDVKIEKHPLSVEKQNASILFGSLDRLQNRLFFSIFSLNFEIQTFMKENDVFQYEIQRMDLLSIDQLNPVNLTFQIQKYWDNAPITQKVLL